MSQLEYPSATRTNNLGSSLVRLTVGAARSASVDLLVSAALAGLAASIRFPNLYLIPRFTDEMQDVRFARRIAEGGFWPTVSPDTYNGPLYHYLLALGLWSGGGPEWPRLFSLLLGSLTVGLTYWLARSLALIQAPQQMGRARWAGMVAAALLMVSFVPIIVNSHIAWSMATTPFWVTLALLAFSETYRRNTPKGLVLCGFLAGLAAQTHPVATVILVGAVGWMTLMYRPVRQTRWGWLGGLTGLVAVGNLIGYNVMTRGGSIAQASTRAYAWTGGTDLMGYWTNLKNLLFTAHELVSSTFVYSLPAEARDNALWSPAVLSYAIVAVAGLLYTARRAGLPLVCWLAVVVVFPYVNQACCIYLASRYLAPLLPATFAAVGVLLGSGLQTAAWRAIQMPFLPKRMTMSAGAMVWVATAALALVLVVYPVWRLQTYYQQELQAGRSNIRLWQFVEVLDVAREEGVAVYVEEGLRRMEMEEGGNIYQSMTVLTSLRGISTKLWRAGRPYPPAGSYFVLADATRNALASDLELEPLALRPFPAPADPADYGVYRVMPSR